MNKQTEALTLALEALELLNMKTQSMLEQRDAAITTIKEALAQPEQEPDDAIELFEYWNAVEGWVKVDEVRQHFDSVGCGTIYKTAGEGREPVYTTPPKRTWVELTEQEALDCFSPNPVTHRKNIETKLKEKNT